MKITITIAIYVLFINIILLSGCSTKNITPEEEKYLNLISEKTHNSIFNDSEIETVWKRAKKFWEPYSPLKEYSINKFETNKSLKTEITYTIKRVPLPDSKYIVKIIANLSNPLMTKVALRNTALFYEYINTDKLKYPHLVLH